MLQLTWALTVILVRSDTADATAEFYNLDFLRVCIFEALKVFMCNCL